MLIPAEAEKVQSNVDVAELLKIFYTHGAFNFLLPPLHLDFIIAFLKNENQLQCCKCCGVPSHALLL